MCLHNLCACCPSLSCTFLGEGIVDCVARCPRNQLPRHPHLAAGALHQLHSDILQLLPEHDRAAGVG